MGLAGEAGKDPAGEEVAEEPAGEVGKAATEEAATYLGARRGHHWRGWQGSYQGGGGQ